MEHDVARIIRQIESSAQKNNVELYIDSNGDSSFTVVVNSKGDLGAIGRIKDFESEDGQRLYFCKFNHKTYQYAVDEGFKSSVIYNSFKDRLFIELDKNTFINYITSR
jgi:hypothetical protein